MRYMQFTIIEVGKKEVKKNRSRVKQKQLCSLKNIEAITTSTVKRKVNSSK